MERTVNKKCAYYPCHKRLEDCTFCYCPFYPCLDNALGYYVFGKKKRRVWACDRCEWIHRKNVVNKIFKLIHDF